MSGIIGSHNIRGSGLIKKLTADGIDDDAITLAKMVAGTDGNLISYDTSGNPVAVATGSDGQVLTSSGAGAVCAFEDAGGGLLTHINSTTLSGAAIAQNGVFTSTYRNYFITFENLHSSTDSIDMRFKFYQSAGPTDDSASSGGLSGYGQGMHPEVRWNASNDAILAQDVETQAGDGVSGFMYVFLPISTAQSSSKMVWNVAWTHGTANTSGGANGWNCMDSTYSHTGIYWHISSGSYDGGIVTVYGITDPT